MAASGTVQYILLGTQTLLLLLLCWQHAWSDVRQTQTHHCAPTSVRQLPSQTQPVELSVMQPGKRELAAARLVSPPFVPPPPPPSASSGSLVRAPHPSWLALSQPAPYIQDSVAEKKLKLIWRLRDERKAGSRAALVEIHNDSWSFLNDRQLAKGTDEGDPLRMQCFAARLLAGETTRLSTVGGSVSFGTTFTTSRSKALYHWKVYQWINETFGGPRHEHYCGAVAASGPSYMEHCLHWHVVDNADVVLVEYAVNLDEHDRAGELASFERMLRKLLRMPRQPAVILVNTMELFPPRDACPACGMAFSGNKAYLDGYSDGAPSAEDMRFEYPAWAEDGIARMGRYYGVPTVSLRDALFHELKAREPTFPLKQVFHDRHHPGAWGHSLLAQMVVELVSRTASWVAGGGGLAVGASTPRATRDRLCEAAQAEAARRGAEWLHKPLYSETAEAQVGVCVKGEEVKSLVAPGSSRGFAYKVEGADAKMKPGLIGGKPGDSVSLCVDVSRLARGQPFVAILGHLISYEHMGAVSVECVGDCECKKEEVDAHVQGGKFSVFKARTLTLKRADAPPPAAQLPTQSKECGCALKLDILSKSGSGEHKFKVLSLMTSVREGSLRYGHQTGFNVRPMGARLN